MAVFVDLDEEENGAQRNGDRPWNGRVDAVKPHPATVAIRDSETGDVVNISADAANQRSGHESVARENPNQNKAVTRALGCYPIIMAVASSIDLNTLDNLSRTCHQIRQSLLQYRKSLIGSTLRCSWDHLPVDPESTLRYRARAGNWWYMEDVSRSSYNGKSGRCARDLVSECRRCGTVVCRNCTIKQPAPVVLRDRHRRLCQACVNASLGSLVKPPLGPEIPVNSDDMERAICKCGTEGVWLCQPCGRSIRSDDGDYKSIWRWRHQYTNVLGGLGTGIGEGDRGVPCGRESECCAAREREQETDGDAEDAKGAQTFTEYQQQQQQLQQLQHMHEQQLSSDNPLIPSTISNGSVSSPFSSFPPEGTLTLNGTAPPFNGSHLLDNRRTPSPAFKPGYERHEVEGIGGVVKKLIVRTVKVGACVPEFPDEIIKGEILGREVRRERRSWCGWCKRVIPSMADYENDRSRREGGDSSKGDQPNGQGLEGRGKGKEKASASQGA